MDADTKQPITTISCIKAVLDNTAYENRGDQRKADRIYDVVAACKDSIDLEDADFTELKGYMLQYKPFLNGRTFAPILSQFEE